MQTSNNKNFNKPVMTAITVVPNSATDLATKDCTLYSVNICNTTAGAVTFTLTDKQSTPRNVFKAQSIAANTTLAVSWNEGIPMSGGLAWTASAATSLEGYVDARVKI